MTDLAAALRRAGHRVRVHGPATAPPLVLLHSFGLDGASFDALADELGEEFCSVALDLPGHGTDAGSRPVDFERLTAAAGALVIELAARAAAPVHLLGHSLGGAVALTVATRYPSSVAALAVVASPPRGVPAFAERAAGAPAAERAAAVDATLARWFTAGELESDAPAVRYARRALADLGDTAWESTWRSFATWPGVDRFRPRTPAIVVAGSDDLSTPPAVMEPLAEALDVEVAIVPGGTHMLPTTRAPELARILREHWSHPQRTVTEHPNEEPSSMSTTDVRIVRQSDRRHRIAVIDGPNMSNLGARSKKVYGAINSLDDLKALVTEFGDRLGVEIETFSSNYQGAILEFIHESASRVDGYIINPAGLTTVGEGVRHALEDTGRPAMEVHFANIAASAGGARGLGGGSIQSSFTHTMTGMTMGMRQYSYLGALTALTLALDDEGFLGAGLAD